MNIKVLSIVVLTFFPVSGLALGYDSRKKNDIEVEQEVEVESNNRSSVQVKTKQNEVGRPASIYLADACSSGASGSGVGVGVSVGAGNPACLWVTLSQTAYNQGDYVRADRYLTEAEAVLRRQNNIVVRWLQHVPLLGGWF